MAKEIKMPQLSDTMHSGKILTWSVKEGQTVSRGDIVAEVETDKANLEIECFDSGQVLKILVSAGQEAKVGDVIAVIGQPGESYAGGDKPQKKEDFKPNIGGLLSNKDEEKSKVPVSVPVPPKPTLAPTSSEGTQNLSTEISEGERLKVSPLARKLASQGNISLSEIQGSGPDGRIVKRDIENARTHTQAQSTSTEAAPGSSQTTQAPTTTGVSGAGKLTALSKMRATIASRMQASVREAPHFYLTAAINMESALELRQKLKGTDAYKGLSINHLVIKACAYALAKEPRVNNAVRDNMLWEPGEINIGIITAVEDGLLIPVIKNADRLDLKALAFEAKAAVERARAGRPNSSDLLGGTFSISNMGMFGIESFTAIINPGQGAILAVGAILDQPIVHSGAVIPGKVMKVNLSVDHRIIDGAMGANFLNCFKEALENPALLFV